MSRWASPMSICERVSKKLGSGPSGVASARSWRCESMLRWFRTTPHSPCSSAAADSAAEGSLDYPAPGQYLESPLPRGPSHQLQTPATHFLGPLHQFAAVGPVGPNHLQPGILPHHTLQYQLGAVPILNVGRMHRHCQQKPQGIHHNMPFAALHLLARIVTPWPPFSAVFTDWLSMIAALGLTRRPSD